MVYEAQNLQALNAEKLHMEKPQRDVPKERRKLENKKIKSISAEIYTEFKETPQTREDSKQKHYKLGEIVLLSTRWQNSLDNETW